MDYRTFTANLFKPSGTPAGTYEFKIILDAQYQRANGLAVYVNKDGGLTNFQLGVRDDAKVYASPTNAAYFQAGVDCPKRERLTPVSIVCDGTQLTIQLVLPAGTSNDLNVDVVFNLER